MLLLLFSGAKSGTPPAPPLTITKCCFQPSAFQNNAFQNCAKTVGWHPSWGFSHDPAELERRLKKQRGVSSAWFDDFMAAERAALERVNLSKSAKQKAALDTAAAKVYAAVEDAIAHEWEPPLAMIALLAAAASATRLTASIKHSETIVRMAEQDDEEETLMLLLH